MTLQQLEYILAIDSERHFVKAAQKCFVTQATLSMMIKKLENELEVKIFDRASKPVTLTKAGRLVVEHARRITTEMEALYHTVSEWKGEVTGVLHLGIIPTLAPYLLPLFLRKFSLAYPQLKIVIRELTTHEITVRIRNRDLDIGILATPLKEAGLTEYPLFYEEFYAYASKSENLNTKKYLLPEDINPQHLWILEEGHCMRNQMINFCQLKKTDENDTMNIRYEAGSIETLINLVNKDSGITILPKLATVNLSKSQQNKLREFAHPKPVREISLVVLEDFSRKKIMEQLHSIISFQIKDLVPVRFPAVKKNEINILNL